MQIKYVKNELIKTKWGKINCMVFIPQLQEGRVFKEEEEMKIWISDDENKLMIKVLLTKMKQKILTFIM